MAIKITHLYHVYGNISGAKISGAQAAIDNPREWRFRVNVEPLYLDAVQSEIAGAG